MVIGFHTHNNGLWLLRGGTQIIQNSHINRALKQTNNNSMSENRADKTPKDPTRAFFSPGKMLTYVDRVHPMYLCHVRLPCVRTLHEIPPGLKAAA